MTEAMERWRDWRIMSSGGPGRGAYPAGELMTALDFRPRGVRRGEGAPGGVAGGLANRFPNSRYIFAEDVETLVPVEPLELGGVGAASHAGGERAAATALASRDRGS